MRTLRFSAVLTVFFFTILPAVLGFIVGAVFFVYHLLSHLGGELSVENAFRTWLLTVMHGLVMYAIPSFVLGLVMLFLLDKGIAKARFLFISLGVAVIMTIWAITTVGFVGPVWVVFVVAFLGWMFFLPWVTVPMEQRKVPRVFDGLYK